MHWPAAVRRCTLCRDVSSFRSPYRRPSGTFSSCAAAEWLRWSHSGSQIRLYELLARFFASFGLSRRYAAALARIQPVPALSIVAFATDSPCFPRRRAILHGLWSSLQTSFAKSLHRVPRFARFPIVFSTRSWYLVHRTWSVLSPGTTNGPSTKYRALHQNEKRCSRSRRDQAADGGSMQLCSGARTLLTP